LFSTLEAFCEVYGGAISFDVQADALQILVRASALEKSSAIYVIQTGKINCGENKGGASEGAVIHKVKDHW